MKTIKKSLSLFISFFVLSAIFVFAPTSSAKVKAADIPVQLYYAKLISEYSGAAGHTEGYIAIQNLGYQKNVTVHYSYDNGTTWADTSASYYKTNTDGYEVWSFSTPSQFTGGITFSIKYDVNGQTYTDNNNGNNYFMLVGRTAFGRSLLNTYAYNGSVNNGVKNLQGNICLKNISYDKTVTVRVTEDNWVTYKDIPAQYSYNDNYSDNEFWTFNYSTTSPTNQIQFAICYKVNGAEYWDNNFGSNYSVNY